MILYIFATIVIALLFGLYRRPLSQRDRDKGRVVADAIRNSMAVQIGETLAGQGGWKFGPPPPAADLEPGGAHVEAFDPLARAEAASPEGDPG